MATQGIPSYIIAADNHNLGNVRSSWLDPDSWVDKFGNAGKFAAISIISGVNSIYNSAVSVGKFLGADLEENNTNVFISQLDSDLGRYYRANQDAVDTVGFIAISLVPGIGGVKLLNAGQKALEVGVKSGKIGGNMAKATGLLVPKTAMYLDNAVDAINSSTTTLKLLNANTVKAIGAGLQSNVLEAAAFETMVQLTMFKSPILEKQDVGDIVSNIALGGVVGGAIGGAFGTAKLFGKIKSAVKAEDEARLPFIDRPNLIAATPASERIIQFAFDADASAFPVKFTKLDGSEVSSFNVTNVLSTDKITASFNGIRRGIVDLAGGDNDFGNFVASLATPVLKDGKYVSGYSQRYYEEFSGALHILKPGVFAPIELKVAKQIENGVTPDKNLAIRYIRLNGENVGEVLATPPKVQSIADFIQGGEKGIKEYARKQGFSNKLDGSDLWDLTKNLGRKNPQVYAQARYVWADSILKEIPAGSSVHKFDIPVLERAWKDGVYDLRIVSGEGPSLEVVKINSKSQLLDVIKESKEVAANTILERFTLKKTGKIPIEESEELIPVLTNTRLSYLHQNPSVDITDDLFARQSYAKDHQKKLEARGISKSTSEYTTDPSYQPSYARVVYEVDRSRVDVDENVLNGIVWYKQQQKEYVENSKRVAARVFGELSEALPDIPEKALLQVSRVEDGAGTISYANPGYGALGSFTSWIGSVVREAKARARKSIADDLQGSLVAMGQKPEAAFEFEGINQRVSRSPHLWLRYSVDDEHYLITDRAMKATKDVETNELDFDTLFSEFPEDLISLKNSETISAIDAHIKLTSSRTQKFREIHAAQGKTDNKNPDVFRPIRPDLKQYPHFAMVLDERVTGSGHKTMIHAASENELAQLIDKAKAISGVKVLTKSELEDNFWARGEYEFQRTLHENYLNTELNSKGIFSNFFPKSEPGKIVDDILQQHYRESDGLIMEGARLRYEPEFVFLENLGQQYSKVDASQFATRRDLIEKTAQNPYFNQIKTALDISKVNEHPLIFSANKALDTAVSKAVGAYRDATRAAKSPEDLAVVNGLLDKYGLKPAFYDASLQALANHTAPKGELTKFVRDANGILASFTLGLDPLNALNNAIGSNIQRTTELTMLTKAIKSGNAKVAGELSEIAKIKLPGVDDEILSPTKLVKNAIKAFWDDMSVGMAGEYRTAEGLIATRVDANGKVIKGPGPLLSKYKNIGLIKDRLEQLQLLVDDFTLQGTETVAELNKRKVSGFRRAQELLEKGESVTGNKLAEEFNRFISANVMDQLTSVAVRNGLMSEKEALAYINTFVNRVEGNITASQRPMIFQGPIGQAIGLFQSYQFNLMQQLFRYVTEGTKKDVAMLAGLQSTLYGIQSLPAFQFMNTHIVGQMSGNTEHRDAYDLTYGAVGRTAGDFILYGLPSNILQTNIYSRGDINPRHVTILPTSLQEIPLVQGWGKFLTSVKDTVKGVAGGGDVWETFLQGVEHNGISRPLAGFAQTLQAFGPDGKAYSTSSKGSILYENDLMSLATMSRLAGGRPLDEAVVNDAMFRVRTYEAARRQSMLSLSEKVKTNLIAGNDVDEEEIAEFARKYAALGGRQENFNKWMLNLHTSANESQSQQLRESLSNPFAYKMQLLMGGEDE